MTRYAALLRGVSPINLKMPDLTHALNAMGFKDVKTVLASGNVVFSGPKASEATVARKVEAALEKHAGRKFPTIVRTIKELEALLDKDPFAKHCVSAKAKRELGGGADLRRRSNLLLHPGCAAGAARSGSGVYPAMPQRGRRSRSVRRCPNLRLLVLQRALPLRDGVSLPGAQWLADHDLRSDLSALPLTGIRHGSPRLCGWKRVARLQELDGDLVG